MKAKISLKNDQLPQTLAEIPEIQEALGCLDNMSLDEEEREFYESHLKWILDEELAIKKALRVGREEGIEIGKQEGIELGKQEGHEVGKQEGLELGKLTAARNFKQLGIAPSVIIQATGLTEDEINAL